MKAINLAEKLATFSEHWQPRVVGQFNGHDLMVVKVQGEFVWHKHDDTDDFFRPARPHQDPDARGRRDARSRRGLRRSQGGGALPRGRGGGARAFSIEPMGTPSTATPSRRSRRR